MATTVLEFMGQDHDRLDELFKQFQRSKTSDTARAKTLFVEFLAGLQRHIVREEELLFPLFENAMGMRDQGPTAVMRMEHRQIKDFLKSIQTRLSPATRQQTNSNGGSSKSSPAITRRKKTSFTPGLITLSAKRTEKRCSLR